MDDALVRFGILVGFCVLIVLAVIGWLVFAYNKDNLYEIAKTLGYRKASLKYSGDMDKLRDIVLPLRGASTGRYEATAYCVDTKHGELFFGSNEKSDKRLRIWFMVEHQITGLHMVLDGNQNDGLLNSNLISERLPGMELNLDGRFDEHFKGYCEDGQQIYALQIFAPDLLWEIMQSYKNFDIEIIGKHIALNVPGGAADERSVQQALAHAEKLIPIAESVLLVKK